MVNTTGNLERLKLQQAVSYKISLHARELQRSLVEGGRARGSVGRIPGIAPCMKKQFLTVYLETDLHGIGNNMVRHPFGISLTEHWRVGQSWVEFCPLHYERERKGTS